MKNIEYDEIIKHKIELETEKTKIETELAEVEGHLIENKLIWDRSGDIAEKGTLPKLKSRQAELDGARRIVNIKLTSINKELEARNRFNIPSTFMELCRKKLDTNIFNNILDEAHTLVKAVKNNTESR